ncbi:MAG: hypothetical protein ACRDIB_15255 [Ardenticatenaceae bacterium]
MAPKVRAALVAPASGLRYLLLILLLAACGPEASRIQGGGAGADTGNRPADGVVEIHGQTNPSYQTPLSGQAITEGSDE